MFSTDNRICRWLPIGKIDKTNPFLNKLLSFAGKRNDGTFPCDCLYPDLQPYTKHLFTILLYTAIHNLTVQANFNQSIFSK